MGIYHNVMFCSLFNGVEVMIVSPLTVVIFSARKDIAYITALDGVVAILVHKVVSGFHVALVVAQRTGSFVVHHKFDAFVVSVFVEHFNVEIGHRGYKVEHVFFLVANPVFPTDVPAFNEELVKAVSKVFEVLTS